MKQLLSKILAFEKIDGGGICPPYLYRWRLFGFGSWFKVYLHQFVGDDWALDPHDHPKRFISIGIKGWYAEDVFNRDGNIKATNIYTAPWIRTFPADHTHRIRASVHGNVWTICIVFNPNKPWGFIHNGTWIKWDRYTFGGFARKSC